VLGYLSYIKVFVNLKREMEKTLTWYFQSFFEVFEIFKWKVCLIIDILVKFQFIHLLIDFVYISSKCEA